MRTLLLATAIAAIAAITAAPLGAGDAPPQVKPATGPVVVSPAPRPFLGVNTDDNSANFDPSGGLPIIAVIPGSTAATLGLLPGDHLMTFNGLALHAQADLQHALTLVKVGDGIAIQFTRKSGDKSESKTVNGIIQERPQIRTLTTGIRELGDELNRVRAMAENAKKKDISLAEVLQQLKELEQNLPAAVADFKKQYPKGEFNISIKIDIVSDKTASQPLEVGNQPSADIKIGPGAAIAPGTKGDDAGGKAEVAPHPAAPAKP